MVDCRNGEIRDQLPDYVHDQLDARSRTAVAAHVADCAACAAEVTLLRELRATMHSAPDVDVARIVAALPAPPAAGRARRDRWRQVDWRVAAAVVALAVGGGSALLWTGRSRGLDPRAAPIVQQVAPGPRPTHEVAAAVSIDADLAEASLAEIETLLEELDSFDGLPVSEPEPLPALPATAEQGL